MPYTPYLPPGIRRPSRAERRARSSRTERVKARARRLPLTLTAEAVSVDLGGRAPYAVMPRGSVQPISSAPTDASVAPPDAFTVGLRWLASAKLASGWGRPPGAAVTALQARWRVGSLLVVRGPYWSAAYRVHPVVGGTTHGVAVLSTWEPVTRQAAGSQDTLCILDEVDRRAGRE